MYVRNEKRAHKNRASLKIDSIWNNSAYIRENFAGGSMILKWILESRV
jgi:hypothetical protein